MLWMVGIEMNSIITGSVFSVNISGEQHHAWKLLCNVLSFTIIGLTKTVLYGFH
jgi:hypothetical protein